MGHRPGRLAAEGPFEIKVAHGLTVELSHLKTGDVRKDIHADNLMYLRSDVDVRRVMRIVQCQSPTPLRRDSHSDS